MSPQLTVFALLSAIGIGSAIMVVTRRNLVHAALYLVVTFLSVAAVYVLLHAEFLAAAQVLVYAGGIMVLFLFVILLVDVPRVTGERAGGRRGHVASAVTLTALVVGLLASFAFTGGTEAASDRAVLAADGGNLETVALELFRHYLLPFEAVSILLLVAMVGVIVLARSKA